MAKSHQSKFQITDEWQHSKANGISTPVDSKAYRYVKSLADGSGDNQAQDMFVDRFELSATEEKDYDLSGVVKDVFGDVLTFATIKQILVENTSDTAGDILIVGGGPITTGGALISTIFLGGGDAGLRVFPSGCFVWMAPLTGAAVTGGSADVLRIYNAGTGPITYNLIIKGTR